MLLPAEVDLILEKKNGKKDAIIAFTFSGFEMICALIANLKTLHIRVSKV